MLEGILVAGLAPSPSAGTRARLYVATGGFMGMNGNYGAGVLEGIAHFYPEIAGWLCPPGASNNGKESGCAD